MRKRVPILHSFISQLFGPRHLYNFNTHVHACYHQYDNLIFVKQPFELIYLIVLFSVLHYIRYPFILMNFWGIPSIFSIFFLDRS